MQRRRRKHYKKKERERDHCGKKIEEKEIDFVENGKREKIPGEETEVKRSTEEKKQENRHPWQVRKRNVKICGRKTERLNRKGKQAKQNKGNSY